MIAQKPTGEVSQPTGGPAPMEVASPEMATGERQPLMSVPGVEIKEEFGQWMKATKTFRQRQAKGEEEKRSNTNRSKDRWTKCQESTRYKIPYLVRRGA